MYTTTLTSGSSFFSRGVPGWPPPTESVFSGLAKLPPPASVAPGAAGDSSQFSSARGLLPGSEENPLSGVSARHNFTHYADSRFGTLLVTNSFGLVGGRETETDNDYRFRLNLKIQSSAGANEAALRFELLQIPGIQDLVFERQAGAFIVYVYGISPNVSPGLLQNVQNAINDKAAYPLTGLAVAPDLVGISLATTVEFKTGTSVDEKNLALEAAAAAVENLRTPCSHDCLRRQFQPGISPHKLQNSPSDDV